MIRIVFFLVYGVHRELRVLTHSFPTRRSSDLFRVAIGRNIIRNVAFGEDLCFHDQRHFLRLLAKADFIAGLHEPRGDVALYAVYINVAVAHELASRADRSRTSVVEVKSGYEREELSGREYNQKKNKSIST